MKREDFTIDGIPDGYVVYDVDLTPSGRSVAGLAHPTRDLPVFVLSVDGRLLPLHEQSGHAPYPALRPKIRCKGEADVVVVKHRLGEPGEPTAWVLNDSGRITAEFNAGDGVEDVLASSKWIVLTYFDEGVFSGIEPGQEGLAFFDSNGIYQFGYRTLFGNDAVEVIDCYAAAWIGEDTLVFCPYTGFEVVLLYLNGPRQDVLRAPDDLHGSNAIAGHDDRIYFFSPYKLPGQLVSWKPGTNDWEVVGSFDGYLRGLPGGRFISPKPDGYTILSID